MPRRYNEWIASQVMEAGGPKVDAKTGKWMRELWIQQLGWEHAKTSFIQNYTKAFTEAELKEIVGLLDHPLVTKLFATETQAVAASGQERAERFLRFWERYNNFEFPPPP